VRFPFCKSTKSALSRKEESKMKKILLMTAALALLATTAASAQTIRVKVTVPFDFSISHATLPAGQYVVTSADLQGEILAIRNLDSRATKLVLSNACTSGKSASQTKFVFHRYGNHYFLSQIWMEGSDRGRELPQSAREKEIAMDYSMKEVVLVASR
jgi:hypothetical protein